MPDFFDEFVCPHCQKLTSFQLETQIQVDGFIEYLTETSPIRVDLKAVRYSCQNPNCTRPILVLQRNGVAMAQLYPSAGASRALDVAAPSEVAGAFLEASQCQAMGAMRAAGVMYRMALELICDEQGIPRSGPNSAGKPYWQLANRVPDLEDRGLPSDLVENMHEVRLVGNDSIHQGIAFSMEELDDIASMIEEAVEVLWVQPARRKAMKTARQIRRAAAKSEQATPQTNLAAESDPQADLVNPGAGTGDASA